MAQSHSASITVVQLFYLIYRYIDIDIDIDLDQFSSPKEYDAKIKFKNTKLF